MEQKPYQLTPSVIALQRGMFYSDDYRPVCFYEKMFNTLLFFYFLCILAYVIGEYILN